MSDVVLFGNGKIAELALFYLTEDSPHDVVAFTVDRPYVSDSQFHGLPVVAFDEVDTAFPPARNSMFLPISYRRMNHVRAEKVGEAKAKGYELISYVSSHATTFSDFNCGENCFILEDNTIQPYVEIGYDVILWSGNHIGHHSRIGDHVMISSQVVVSGGCTIEPHCFIGVNATIRDETVIARETLVGAGTTIMSDTEPFAVFNNRGTPPRAIRSDRVRQISHKSDG